jgi:hypothetical protein
MINIKGKIKNPLMAAQFLELFTLQVSAIQSHYQLLLFIKIHPEYILALYVLV